ncbi:unnamed protein product [Gongylonema pulchrum]|uniref:Uncharacterized protein n=1 Tax=Gongylonema pulchrum TaxID=637853 RepID=A0A183DVT6_9BILA|nr:unnamed protein product [Gongylonema pulchrum]
MSLKCRHGIARMCVCNIHSRTTVANGTFWNIREFSGRLILLHMARKRSSAKRPKVQRREVPTHPEVRPGLSVRRGCFTILGSSCSSLGKGATFCPLGRGFLLIFEQIPGFR